MALLFFDGFDHYGAATINPAAVGKWGALSFPAGTSAVATARTGTQALSLSSSTITTKTYSTSGGAVVGVAFRTSAISAFDLIQVRETAIVHVAVGITAGGLLTVKRGATVLATGTTVLTINNWYYIELKTVIHDSTGTYEVHLDGVAEPNLTATGQDTQNAGTGAWNNVNIGTIGIFDDFYLCDTSGSAPRNTFLGTVKVDTIYPQTDAVAVGSNTGLTPSTGTDHGALVDEVIPNTTDYNSSPTVGLKDTYNYPSMALTGTVLGVQTNMYVAKSDAVARQVCPVVRMAGVDTDGTSIAPTTTFLYYSQVWQQDPNAGSPIEWTTTNIASIQVGMKVTV